MAHGLSINVGAKTAVISELSSEDVDWCAAHQGEPDSEMEIIQRGWRDALIAETDIFALADRSMTDAMTAYRQALRDLPTTDAGWPQNVTWPTCSGFTTLINIPT